jgi:hypothetical protein
MERRKEEEKGDEIGFSQRRVWMKLPEPGDGRLRPSIRPAGQVGNLPHDSNWLAGPNARIHRRTFLFVPLLSISA